MGRRRSGGYEMSARRRISIASYRPPREGVIHGSMTLDCSKVAKYLAEVNAAGAQGRDASPVTITAFVGAVVGRALRASPSLNGRIHLGRYIPHERVNVAFLVQVNDGENLAQVLVEDIDELSPVEVHSQLRAKAEAVRSGKDENFEKSINLTRRMPTPILRRVLSFGGFVTTGLGLPFAGQPAFPFGSAVITSVGMLGVDEAFVPPTPFLRVPLYVAIGRMRDMVFAESGEPVVRPGITLTATLDHRFIDGFQAGVLANRVREGFDNPWLLGPDADVGRGSAAPS